MYDYHDGSGRPISKRQWMQSLKVGDYVCDCRYKHLPIKEIREQRCLRFNRAWILLTYLGDFGTDILCWVSRRLRKNKFFVLCVR